MIKHPFDSDDMDRTMPRTEDSAERGLVEEGHSEPESYENLGESDAPDQDDGDIADEGFGHRG